MSVVIDLNLAKAKKVLGTAPVVRPDPNLLTVPLFTSADLLARLINSMDEYLNANKSTAGLVEAFEKALIRAQAIRLGEVQ